MPVAVYATGIFCVWYRIVVVEVLIGVFVVVEVHG